MAMLGFAPGLTVLETEDHYFNVKVAFEGERVYVKDASGQPAKFDSSIEAMRAGYSARDQWLLNGGPN